MRTRLELGAERPSKRQGFTLTELLVVITIIGIIIAFLLNAAMDGVRRAEERATQSLITKLEGGLNDRLDALLQSAPTPNYAHGYLAGVYPGGTDPYDGWLLMLPSAVLPSGLPNPKCNTTQRAQVIATFDYIKAELPDVFFVDPAFLKNPNSNTVSYPINFTGLPFYPPNYVELSTLGAYMLPLGHMIQGPRNALTGATAWTEGYGDSHPDPVTGYLVSTHPELGFTGSGINGASYSAAAALYKNLGYAPIGYDMIDNDGNGLVDDWAEAITGLSATQVNNLIGNIQAHKHNTARAEMLYAILVEGAGPLGSVFNRDDFTDKEVKDTDGDGLPEFVDAWGQPLQFFRWPLLYHSDIQRGQAFAVSSTSSQGWTLFPPYTGPLAQREQDPLDVNQQLVATAWWSTVGNGGLSANPNSPFAVTPSLSLPAAANVSPAALFFGTMFHTLFEPLPLAGNGVDWDRSGNSNRRAFFTKFLVLSGGQDQVPGVFLYTDQALTSFTTADIASAHLIANENNAMPFGWTSGAPDVDFMSKTPTGAPIGLSNILYNVQSIPSYPTTYETFQAAQDDITNQNLMATGGIGGSG